MRILVGVNNKAQEVTMLPAGVSNEAVRIRRGFAGVNNIARQVWSDNRQYLFADGNPYTAVTGGWNGTLDITTNAGASYRLTLLQNDGTYLSGNFSSTAGTVEMSAVVRTTGAIDVTNYSRLICTMALRTTSSSAGYGRIGLMPASISKVTTNNLLASYVIYGEQEFIKASAVAPSTLSVDISAITGSYTICFTKYQSNVNGAYYMQIREVYLM